MHIDSPRIICHTESHKPIYFMLNLQYLYKDRHCPSYWRCPPLFDKIPRTIQIVLPVLHQIQCIAGVEVSFCTLQPCALSLVSRCSGGSLRGPSSNFPAKVSSLLRCQACCMMQCIITLKIGVFSSGAHHELHMAFSGASECRELH